MKQLFLLLLVLSVNLLVQYCTGGSEVWGKAEVSGRVVDADGNPVSGVTVKLYPNNGKLLEESSASVKTSSKNGEYSFEYVPSGSYVVQGIDSLSGTVVEFLRRNIDHDSAKGKTDLKNDTLKHPGKLRVILKNANGKFNGSNGYIPHAPYSYHVVYDTLDIPRIARGKYICEFEQVTGFSPVVTDSFNISPDSLTVIIIDVKIDPNGAPPTPTNLFSAGIIDTVLGKAVLMWDPVKVSDLRGYIVLGGTNRDLLKELDTTKNTIDTVNLIVDTTGKFITNYFQVTALDTLNTRSIEGSSIINVPAPSPAIVKTIISDTLIIPHDKLYIGDTARIRVTVKNANRLIDSITWAYGRVDSIVKATSCGGRHDFVDEMLMVWKDSSEKTWYITAYDNSGTKTTLVKAVNGSGLYAPNKWQIYPASLPTPRMYLNLISYGGSIYGIGGCRNDPRFIGRFVALDVIESFSPDSNTSFKSSKMKTARYHHASFVYNDKIYSLGAFPNKPNVSSLEMFDPVTQQSTMIATLPNIRFGCAVSIIGEKCYMIGGSIYLDTNDLSLENSEITGSIDAFEIPVTAQGELRIEHIGDLIVPRSNHAAVVYKGQIFVLGGIGTNSLTLTDVERFDLSTGMKTKLPSMKNSRCHFSAVENSGKVFVFGGYVSADQSLNSVEMLDLISQDEWATMKAMDKPRYGMSTVAHNGKVYMMGGMVFSNGSTELDTTISIYYP